MHIQTRAQSFFILLTIYKSVTKSALQFNNNQFCIPIVFFLQSILLKQTKHL